MVWSVALSVAGYWQTRLAQRQRASAWTKYWRQCSKRNLGVIGPYDTPEAFRIALENRLRNTAQSLGADLQPGHVVTLCGSSGIGPSCE